MNFRDIPNLKKFEAARPRQLGERDRHGLLQTHPRSHHARPQAPQSARIQRRRHDRPQGQLRSRRKIDPPALGLRRRHRPDSPRPWDYLPDYHSSLDYFLALNDLELMAVTKSHRITWEAASDEKK